MVNSPLPPSAGYYENTREDIRALLSGKFERSLDVGCGAGAVSAILKSQGIVAEAHGIELEEKAASTADQRLDKVFRLDLSKSSEGLPPQHYDLVLCLDVLEHMTDPWTALTRIRKLLKPNGTLVVSLPNVRNFRVVLPLLFQGKWEYADSGLLDITHLRFFTKASALSLVEKAGFQIVSLQSTSRRRGSKSWWMDTLTLGLFRDFLEFQYVIFAKPDSARANRP